MSQLDQALSALRDFRDAASYSYGFGREDWRRLNERDLLSQGRDRDGTRFNQVINTSPVLETVRQLRPNSEKRQRRGVLAEEIGMGMPYGTAGKAGTVVGRLAADLTQDGLRSIWWLVNAPQAVVNIANEAILNKSNPSLWDASFMLDSKGNKLEASNRPEDIDRAIEYGAIRPSTLGDSARMPGVSTRQVGDKSYYIRRNKRPGFVSALDIMPGVAINAGMGLLTPFGGMQGYEAALPSDADPSRTSNVIGEIGAKYILGRTGNLLPYDEFVKVRPDVSREEYNRYKAFKWDKSLDLDPRDGDVTLPTGVAKFTTEGIHGPELQFLGRSIPLATSLLPVATSIAGGAMGVRPRKGDNPVSSPHVRRGFIGSAIGLGVGMAAGNLIEAERRRRNMRENVAKTQPLDPESAYGAY